MEFEDSFEVPVDVAAAWSTLTDIERVYPCLPGAELKEIKDNEFEGLVTLKLGPITAVYQGVARFEDLDPENHTLVIHAEGRDKHGQGTARARVAARLIPQGDMTRVEMKNEVDVTGKAAQFGRGILQDVSKEILGEFASNLRAVVAPAAPLGREAANGGGAAEPGRPSAPAGARSISVLSLGGRVAARRTRESPARTAAAAAAVIAVVALIVWLLSR